MLNINKVLFGGRVTRKPDFKKVGDTSIVHFSIACNRVWTDKQNVKQEESTFVDCDAFGGKADVINQYVDKGHELFIEGRLKLDKWEQEGQQRSKLVVVVEDFSFIGSPKKDNSNNEEVPTTPTKKTTNKPVRERLPF